jgi:hypothetical protein
MFTQPLPFPPAHLSTPADDRLPAAGNSGSSNPDISQMGLRLSYLAERIRRDAWMAVSFVCAFYFPPQMKKPAILAGFFI